MKTAQNPMRTMTALRAAMAASALAFLPAMSLNADQNFFADGVNWQYSYEANVLPWEPEADPEWSLQSFSGASSEGVEDGIFTISTAEFLDNLSYRQTPSTYWNPTGVGSTIEVRLKIDSQAPGSEWVQTLIISTGVKQYFIGWRENRVQNFNGSQNLLMNTTDDFHIYRFVITGLNQLDMYVDNNPVPAFTAEGADFPENYLEFGKTATLPWGAGVGQWDYVRWTNEGAFAPVPEPSVLALVALGLTAVAYRHRRRMALSRS